MNEPQSVAAEKIALSILAGEDQFGNSKCRPVDLIPITLASSTAWPVAPFSSLFGYQVPDGQVMLWTYVSLYTSLFDESESAVNYGINYNALANLLIQSGSGNFLPRATGLLTQQMFNKPILLMFDSLTTPRITLQPNGSTQAVANLRILCEASGFLLPSGLSSAFKDHQTQFG